MVIGALGRLVVPGRQHIPIWLTIVIGIVAAFIGSFIAGWPGYANANGGFPVAAVHSAGCGRGGGRAIASAAYGRRKRGLLRR